MLPMLKLKIQSSAPTDFIPNVERAAILNFFSFCRLLISSKV